MNNHAAKLATDLGKLRGKIVKARTLLDDRRPWHAYTVLGDALVVAERIDCRLREVGLKEVLSDAAD